MPVLLALDIATRTGWCAGSPGGAIAYGAVRLAPPNAPEGAAFSKLREWIEGAIEVNGITHIFAEEPYVPRPQMRFAKAGASPGFKQSIPFDMKVIKALIGMRAIARMVAFEHQLVYEEYPPDKITKYFTGFARFPGGRAEKKARVCDIAKLYGYDVGSDDDIADAIALWHLGAATVSPYAVSAGPLLSRVSV